MVMYVTSHLRQLSLAIHRQIGTMIASESWYGNSLTKLFIRGFAAWTGVCLRAEQTEISAVLLSHGSGRLCNFYLLFKTQLKDPKCGPLDRSFFKQNKAVAKSPQYIDEREVTGRHKLAPGSYCIVPSTFQSGEEGEFLLRVYTEKPINSGSELCTVEAHLLYNRKLLQKVLLY